MLFNRNFLRIEMFIYPTHLTSLWMMSDGMVGSVIMNFAFNASVSTSAIVILEII